MTDAITSEGRDPRTVRADRDTRGQFIVCHTGIDGRLRGARSKLGSLLLEASTQPPHAALEGAIAS